MSKRVSDLERRTAQLAAQLQAAEASLKDEKRKADARRKIILGAALLTALEKEQDKAKMQRLKAFLLRHVSARDRDFLESFDPK